MGTHKGLEQTLDYSKMGGGNAQKSATARARKAKEAAKKGGGSQLKANAQAMTIKCGVCMQPFQCTMKDSELIKHVEAKHAKKSFADCFPDRAAEASSS